MRKIIFASVLLVFLIYLPMVAPSVAPQGDSGELVTVASTLGIAHPPGYPLYTLLAHAATFLPWGSVAWRINLLSAALHVGTLFFVGLITYRVSRSLLAAAGTVLILAFSGAFWLYSLVAEVFPLNNLLVVMMAYVALVFANKRWFWPAMAFLLGLGLTNHHTIVLALPALGYLLSLKIKQLFNPKNWRNSLGQFLISTAALGLGLSIYGYFYFRREAVVPVAWNFPQDFADIVRLFLRSDYGTFTAVLNTDPALVSLADKARQIVTYSRFLLDDFGFLGIFLALFGFVVGLIKQRRFTIFIFLGWFFSAIAFLSYAAFPITEATGTGLEVAERFYLLPNIFFALAVGLALAFLVEFTRKFTLLRVLPLVVALFCVASLLVTHYNLVDQKGNYLTFNFGRNILSGALPNSVIIMEGDVPTFATFYVRYVENFRPDVSLVTPNLFSAKNSLRYLKFTRPELDFRGVTNQAQLIQNIYREIPVYHFGLPGSPFRGHDATPSGFLFRFYPPEATVGFENWKTSSQNILGAYIFPTVFEQENKLTLGDRVVIGFYPRMFNLLGNHCLTGGHFECAVKYYDQALAFVPDDFWGNLGRARALSQLGECSQAEDIFKKLRLTDDLVQLAKDCFKDEAKANYYLNQKKIIEKKQGGDLKNL